MLSSQAALNLIVEEEDSDQAYYTRHYEHFDWPQGASGPTIGIGYDCGYVTPAEATADWTGIVLPDMVAAIVRACGIKGTDARSFVVANGASVSVSWGQAIAEFEQREMPKWEARVQADLPNTGALSGDSFGALVSLSYNRGCSYDLPGPRYSEMRAIKALMASQKFSQIPEQFLAMRRLWPTGGDLWNRRTHEANLFQQGLGAAA